MIAFQSTLNADSIYDLGYCFVQFNAGPTDSKTEICGAMRNAMLHQDCVGSFNSYNGKLWGSLLLKKQECENALAGIEQEWGL